MSQKDSISRMVNERLAHCKVLLSEAKTASNKVAERAMASAAVLKLEQAVYFHCVELGLLPANLPQKHGQPVKARIGLEYLLSDELKSHDDSNGEIPSSAKEMIHLLTDENSWLSVLIRAKNNEYAVIQRKTNTAARGSIFSTEESLATEESLDSDLISTIALVDVAAPPQSLSEKEGGGLLSVSDIQSCLNLFQGLLERQRANSLEY